MDKTGIAIVGFGYWGPNLVRNFRARPEFNAKYIVERDAKKQEKAKMMYPELTIVSELSEALADPEIHAVAIATPSGTHHPIALEALQAGRHVLIEKPITSSSEKAQELIDEATERGLTLMVDHTFIYTAAVQQIKDRIDSGDLGELYYYDSTRVNLGLFQSDVDVLWDLAVHDLSILMYLREERPVRVSAHGIAHVKGHPENTAYMTLFYDSGFIAHINVNWLSPIKVRQTLIGGEKKMIVYNDLEPTEKIKIYDNGLNVSDNEVNKDKLKIGYRLGDILTPHIQSNEALNDMARHFGECITNKETPRTSAKMGYEIVCLLEAATKSMKSNGAPVELDFGAFDLNNNLKKAG